MKGYDRGAYVRIEGPGFASGFSFCSAFIMPKSATRGDNVKNLKVDKAAFDAILGKLIATPPTPVTPKRKRRKRLAKASQ